MWPRIVFTGMAPLNEHSQQFIHGNAIAQQIHNPREVSKPLPAFFSPNKFPVLPKALNPFYCFQQTSQYRQQCLFGVSSEEKINLFPATSMNKAVPFSHSLVWGVTWNLSQSNKTGSIFIVMHETFRWSSWTVTVFLLQPKAGFEKLSYKWAYSYIPRTKPHGYAVLTVISTAHLTDNWICCLTCCLLYLPRSN